LLFNASFILRLVFPLGINFFSTTLIDRGENTSFEKAIGQINVVPILGIITVQFSTLFLICYLGQKFNLFVPIVISVLCLATFFNFYGRILRLLQITQSVAVNGFILFI
jgi:hypothetical protein